MYEFLNCYKKNSLYHIVDCWIHLSSVNIQLHFHLRIWKYTHRVQSDKWVPNTLMHALAYKYLIIFASEFAI